MTIINEVMGYEKYYNLRFVEFLEMLCRAAIKIDFELSSCRGSGIFVKVDDLLSYLLLRV